MAYISQEQKKEIAALLKKSLKDYPTIKYSLSIHHHSTIQCTISKGPEFLNPEAKDRFNVNHYWIDSYFSGEAAKVFKIIRACLNLDNYDNSDSQTDYFDVGHYISIDVGSYDKPFSVV